VYKCKYFIMAILLLSNLVLGSSMRIAALGGKAGFWPEDDQNIFLFPSTMHNFNLVQINGIMDPENELLEDNWPNDLFSSATFLFGDKTKYGFMLTPAYDYNSGDYVAAPPLANFAFGKGKWGVLIGLNRNASETPSVDSTGASSTSNASDLNLTTRFGMEMGFGLIGTNFNLSSSDNGDGDSDNDPSSMNLSLTVRRDQKLWEFSHLLFGFSFSSSSQGPASTSGLGLNLDLFRHWELNEKTDLLFATGFSFTTSTSNTGASGAKDQTTTKIALPSYTLAVESYLLDWATARVGIVSDHWLTNSFDNGDSKTSSSGFGNYDINFGLGLDYGGFALDLDLNPGLFVNPVNYITGNNLTSPLATMATMTFTW